MKNKIQPDSLRNTQRSRAKSGFHLLTREICTELSTRKKKQSNGRSATAFIPLGAVKVTALTRTSAVARETNAVTEQPLLCFFLRVGEVIEVIKDDKDKNSHLVYTRGKDFFKKFHTSDRTKQFEI